MLAAKARMSLRVRAIWSRLSLSANRTIVYYRIYFMETLGPDYYFAHAQDYLNLRIFSHARRHCFSWRDPVNKM